MLARALRFVILVGACLLLLPMGVTAQGGTPTPSPFTPNPDECTVAPLTAEELRAIAEGEPGPGAFATPALTDAPFGAPDGSPADAETVAAFSAVVRESWACLNGGDWARFFALLTPDGIRRDFAPGDITGLGALPAAPFPPDQWTAVYAILDVEVLPDGRVGGFVIIDTPGDGLPVEINYQIAAETEAGWRMDVFICFNAEGGRC